MMRSPVALSDFLLSLSLLLAVDPWCGVEFGRWVLGRGFDEVGREDHVEGAIHDHLEDLVEGYKAVVTIERSINFWFFANQR